LPTPTIGATTATTADKFFAPVIFTSSATGSVTISSLGFQPDFTWWKSRATVVDHFLMDVLRGSSTYLASNRTLADQSYSNIWIPSSNGWTSNNASFYNNDSNVAWNWKANGSGSSNTAGSITSTVSASTTSGFSIVTYTGNGGTNQSIGHGLGATPGMVIIKNRTLGTANWLVHHQSQPTGYTLYLNLTNAEDSGTSQWGTTPQTSTLFYVGFTGGATGSNNSGDAYVAYCFAPIAGYSAFGSYTGNGSADGPFVFTGFRPAFVLVKNSSTTGKWVLMDTSRGLYNVMSGTNALYPNLSDAEGTDSANREMDFLSNGFKLRCTGGDANGSGNTIIFMAFASAPLKFSLAR
jgi:hypothetical protein